MMSLLLEELIDWFFTTVALPLSPIVLAFIMLYLYDEPLVLSQSAIFGSGALLVYATTISAISFRDQVRASQEGGRPRRLTPVFGLMLLTFILLSTGFLYSQVALLQVYVERGPSADLPVPVSGDRLMNLSVLITVTSLIYSLSVTIDRALMDRARLTGRHETVTGR